MLRLSNQGGGVERGMDDIFSDSDSYWSEKWNADDADLADLRGLISEQTPLALALSLLCNTVLTL